jgi:hypothetical protein
MDRGGSIARSCIAGGVLLYTNLLGHIVIWFPWNMELKPGRVGGGISYKVHEGPPPPHPPPPTR